MARPSPQVVVAVVGAVAAIAVGVFANFDKLKGRPTATSTPPAANPVETPTIQVNPNIQVSPSIIVTPSPPVAPTMETESAELRDCFPHAALLGGSLTDADIEHLRRDRKSMAVALLDAAGTGRLTCVELLLKAGAPPDGDHIAMGDQVEAQTPLVAACQAKRAPIIRALLAAGADANLRALAFKDRGLPPLVAAAESTEAVRLLLESGADVNATNHAGFTALHFAALANNADVARLLLEKGARVDLRDDSGRTALDCAKERNSTLVLRLLYDESTTRPGSANKPA